MVVVVVVEVVVVVVVVVVVEIAPKLYLSMVTIHNSTLPSSSVAGVARGNNG